MSTVSDLFDPEELEAIAKASEDLILRFSPAMMAMTDLLADSTIQFYDTMAVKFSHERAFALTVEFIKGLSASSKLS